MTEHVGQESQILFENRGTLGVITVNRPRALNALSYDMLRGIDRALTQCESDSRVKAVLIQGAGEKGLCAGGDVVSLYHLIDSGDLGEGEEYFRVEYTLNNRISKYPKPIVAIMDGIVLGGGVGISAHASHRVVTEKTRLGMPETGIGFAPDIGGLKLLSQAPRQLGTAMALTGRHVGAADAIVCGLADYYVHTEKLGELISYLESATDAQSIELVISKFVGNTPESVMALNAFWINTAFAGNSAEQIRDAVAEQAEQGNPLAAELIEAMRHNSPTGIKTALFGIRRAKTATLAETLNRDYNMAVNAMRSHDMKEGIRAQVIDKDRDPQWDPATLEEVSETYAASFYNQPDGVAGLGLKDY